MIIENTLIKRRQERKSRSAEEFTPTPLVNEILDRLTIDSNNTVWDEDKTFVDPACGNGNFLIAVLKRKLKKGHNPIKAISTVYGCDIMRDNIEECIVRLIKVLAIHMKDNKIKKEDFSNDFTRDIVRILVKNIKWTPFRNFPNGSLDYDFEFNDRIRDETVDNIIAKIKGSNLLRDTKID
jgi:type I restriction-modification system DNA methylase subunit